MENKTKWKITAIIFIVLFIVETLSFAGLVYLGLSIVNKETECSINVCGDIEDATSYGYDTTTNTCHCYDSYGKVIKTTYIK